MVNKVFKDIESTMKFLTSDGIPNAMFKNGKIVADGSKFDGLPANEKNINEMLDDTDYGIQPGPTAGDAGEQELYRLMIEVFKGNIVGQEAQQIMEAAQGEFPIDFIRQEQQKFMPKPNQSPQQNMMPQTPRMQVPQKNFNQEYMIDKAMQDPNQHVMRQQRTQPSMRNVFEKDRERLLTMATMDKLGLLT